MDILRANTIVYNYVSETVLGARDRKQTQSKKCVNQFVVSHFKKGKQKVQCIDVIKQV